MGQKTFLLVQASHIRPSDLVNGTRKVARVVPNLRKKNFTEVTFDDGETVFYRNKRGVSVTRGT